MRLFKPKEPPYDDINCVRCQGPLAFVADQDLHEGTRTWGFVLGDFGELFTGGTRLELWACRSCGHVEFFLPQQPE